MTIIFCLPVICLYLTVEEWSFFSDFLAGIQVYNGGETKSLHINAEQLGKPQRIS